MGARSLRRKAILAGLVHRNRTGEGQWIDVSCTEAGTTLVGPDLLDYTVNGRPLRRDGEPDSNHSHAPLRVPHGIYPADGDDNWVAIACRDDDDWKRMAKVVDEPWATDPRNDHCVRSLNQDSCIKPANSVLTPVNHVIGSVSITSACHAPCPRVCITSTSSGRMHTDHSFDSGMPGGACARKPSPSSAESVGCACHTFMRGLPTKVAANRLSGIW